MLSFWDWAKLAKQFASFWGTRGTMKVRFETCWLVLKTAKILYRKNIDLGGKNEGKGLSDIGVILKGRVASKEEVWGGGSECQSNLGPRRGRYSSSRFPKGGGHQMGGI